MVRGAPEPARSGGAVCQRLCQRCATLYVMPLRKPAPLPASRSAKPRMPGTARASMLVVLCRRSPGAEMPKKKPVPIRVVVCPRCGFRQPFGLHECRQCGEPFSKAA